MKRSNCKKILLTVLTAAVLMCSGERRALCEEDTSGVIADEDMEIIMELDLLENENIEMFMEIDVLEEEDYGAIEGLDVFEPEVTENEKKD